MAKHVNAEAFHNEWVHDEPDCLGYNRCTYQEAHKHGFACDKTCNECWAVCHPNCPANRGSVKL